MGREGGNVSRPWASPKQATTPPHPTTQRGKNSQQNEESQRHVKERNVPCASSGTSSIPPSSSRVCSRRPSLLSSSHYVSLGRVLTRRLHLDRIRAWRVSAACGGADVSGGLHSCDAWASRSSMVMVVVVSGFGFDIIDKGYRAEGTSMGAGRSTWWWTQEERWRWPSSVSKWEQHGGC